jgi:AcrR family transcriptional regulator
MAYSRVSEPELLGRSAEIFRRHGFEGTSLSQLAAATGLEKASLYHRFPGGKAEIALAVAGSVYAWFEKNVFTPLKAGGSPQKKLRAVTEQLRIFYVDGKMPCALDALSFPGGGEELAAALKAALLAWLKAFTEIARESGLTAADARKRAERAVMLIEGSLVLGRVLGETKMFKQTLEELPGLLMGR